MLSVLAYVPLAVSLVLGGVYLLADDAQPAFKLLGCGAFLVAVYLQFHSRHSLLGLLLQVGLALSLELRRRIEASG